MGAAEMLSTAAQVAAGVSFSYNAPEFLVLRIGLLDGYSINARDLVLLEAGVQKAVGRLEAQVQLLSQELKHEQAVRAQFESGTNRQQAELEVQLLASKAAESALQQLLQQKCNELLLLSRQLQDSQQQLADSQQSVAAADNTLQELRSQVKHLQQQLAVQQQQHQQQQAPAEVSTPVSCKPQAPLLLEVPTGPYADTDTLRQQDQHTPQHTPQAGLRQQLPPLQDQQQHQEQHQHTPLGQRQPQGSRTTPTLRHIPSPLLSPSVLTAPKHSSGHGSSLETHQPSGCDSSLSPSPLPGVRFAPQQHSRGRDSPLVSPSPIVGPVPGSTALGRRSSGRMSPLPCRSPLASASLASQQRSSRHSSPLPSPSTLAGPGNQGSQGAFRRSSSGRDSPMAGAGVSQQQRSSSRIPGAPEAPAGPLGQAGAPRGSSRDGASAAAAAGALRRSHTSEGAGGGSAGAGAGGSVTPAAKLPVFKFTASPLHASSSGPKPFSSAYKPFTPGAVPTPGSSSGRFGSCGNGSISSRARRAARAAAQHASCRPPKHRAPAAAAAGGGGGGVRSGGGCGIAVIGGAGPAMTPKQPHKSQRLECEHSAEFGAEGRKRGWR